MRSPKASERRSRAYQPGPLLAVLGAGLSLALPSAVAAELDVEPSEPAWQRLAAEAPPAPRPPRWLGENVSYRKGVGLEYGGKLKLGDHPLEYGFQGPIVRKKKRVGLTFEVRF